jgi:mannan endo-1,4-beta-mannosidase
MFLQSVLFALVWSVGATTIRLEAEAGQLQGGVSTSTSRGGFSGSGFVTNFANDGARVVLNANIPVYGLYELTIRYASPFGPKGYEIMINGKAISGQFPQISSWTSLNAGKVLLNAGTNQLSIEKGWGYFDVDYLELTTAAPSKNPQKPPAKLSDPNASAQAKALHQKLINAYGSGTFSGDYAFDSQMQDIHKLTGKLPAILGGDFMDYSPSRLPYENPGNATEKNIQRVQQYDFIMKMVWHWNAPSHLKPDQPWYKGFYTYATDFNVEAAMNDPGSADYKLIIRDLDAIAIQLKKFADAKIAVLWRPLHEAEGGWFWWGAKGPQPYIKLYRLMFDRFVNHHGLHNLLWIHNSVNKDWYPGDDVVDIMGVDSYPSDISDPLSSLWDELQQRFDGKKLLAITEFGGVPDVEKMHMFGAKWSFFVTWPSFLHKSDDTSIAKTYNSHLTFNAPQKAEAEALIIY